MNQAHLFTTRWNYLEVARKKFPDAAQTAADSANPGSASDSQGIPSATTEARSRDNLPAEATSGVQSDIQATSITGAAAEAKDDPMDGNGAAAPENIPVSAATPTAQMPKDSCAQGPL